MEPIDSPTLTLAFSARIELLPPIEQGIVDGLQRRFIPIAGGRVSGDRLQADVLPGGGDAQAIGPDGLTEVHALYSLRADDGTIIAVDNRGIRVASPDVSERLARGEPVSPQDYYFRTTPRFTVADGAHGWLRRTLFIARGIRRPDVVQLDVFAVG